MVPQHSAAHKCKLVASLGAADPTGGGYQLAVHGAIILTMSLNLQNSGSIATDAAVRALTSTLLR